MGPTRCFSSSRSNPFGNKQKRVFSSSGHSRQYFCKMQECSKKIYQPGNHKFQTGSWLKKFPSREVAKNFLVPRRGSGGMLPQRILKIKGLRLAKSAFLTFQRPYKVVKH